MPVPIQQVPTTCGGFFQGTTMHVTVGVKHKMLSLLNVNCKMCVITSWRSHSRLRKIAIINVQVLFGRKNPSSLWLQYNCYNIT